MKKPGIFDWGKRLLHLKLPLLVAAIALAVTGCPHNQYVLELKPQGSVIDRTLVFYREEEGNTNAQAPNDQPFDAAELAAIAEQYPADGVSKLGECHVVRGQFANQMPDDIGGAGAYLNLTTSLGEAGFYVERFRGNDDLAGMVERHLKLAENMADLMVGWAQLELNGEKGYDTLHHFLDVDFRRDLKNFGAYWCVGKLTGVYNTNDREAFAVRFGQYLAERGYFKVGDIPALFKEVSTEDSHALLSRVQRLVARKMGVLDTEPVPASLAFLGSNKTLDESLNKYLAGTDAYRAKLDKWEGERKAKPDLPKPDPSEVMRDILGDLVDFDLFGHPDHLTVRLSLPSTPVHSNGRWDEALKQEVWETDFEKSSDASRFPVSCYAGWAEANTGFQLEHFGKVALTGDELLQYGLWRTGQEAGQGAEWDAFLGSLHPGSDLVMTVDAFRFLGEPNQAQTNSQETLPGTRGSAYPRELLKGALR